MHSKAECVELGHKDNVLQDEESRSQSRAGKGGEE